MTNDQKPEIDLTSAEQLAEWLKVTANNVRKVLEALDGSELATDGLRKAGFLSDILATGYHCP